MQFIVYQIIFSFYLNIILKINKNKNLQLALTNIGNCQTIFCDFLYTKRELIYIRYQKLRATMANTTLAKLFREDIERIIRKASVIKNLARLLTSVYYYTHIKNLASLIEIRGILSIRSPNYLLTF